MAERFFVLATKDNKKRSADKYCCSDKMSSWIRDLPAPFLSSKNRVRQLNTFCRLH